MNNYWKKNNIIYIYRIYNKLGGHTTIKCINLGRIHQSSVSKILEGTCPRAFEIARS